MSDLKQISLNSGADLIRNSSEIKKVMTYLNIQELLERQVILTTTTSIASRSPSLQTYLQGEQRQLYDEATKERTKVILQAYENDPSLQYTHNAILANMRANNIEVDRNLADINIPVPLAGSIPIDGVVRTRTNVKVNHATTQAEKNAPLDPTFVVIVGTPVLSFAEKELTARRWSEMENRHLLPNAQATEQELRLELPSHLVLRATSNFSKSEESKEASTSRMQELNNNAAMFFKVVVGTHVTNSICADQVVAKEWGGAWKSITDKLTSRDKLTSALEIFRDELSDIKFCDNKLFQSEQLDHFLHRLSNAEANYQITQQFVDRSPPMQPAMPGGQQIAIPPEQWQLSREQIQEVVFNYTDDAITARYPNSKMYRRDHTRLQDLIDNLCEDKNGENEKVRVAWMTDVNRGLEPHTAKAFINRVRIDMDLRPNSETNNKTVFLVKSKVVAVNNIKTDENPPALKREQGVKKREEKKLCKTCKKFRPEATQRFNRNALLMHTHNTEDCFLEHGAKHEEEPSKKVRFGRANEKLKVKDEKEIKKRKFEKPPKPILKDNKSTSSRSVTVKKIKSEKTKAATRDGNDSGQLEGKESDSETAAESGIDGDGDDSDSEST